MTFAEKVQGIDPRWIWLLAFLIVVAAVLAPVAVPLTVSSSTTGVVDWINGLPKGSVLLVGEEYDPGSAVELSPQLRAVATLAFRRGLKIVAVSTGWPLGPALGEAEIEAAAAQAGGNLQYGVNWVNLGYKPGGEAAENEMVQNFQKATGGVDYLGRPLSSFPLTKSIGAVNSQYFSGIWSEETGSPGCLTWLQNAAIPGKLPLACGAVTGMFPTDTPYLNAGQYKALLNGARGAAELEGLIQHPGLGMASQETAMVVAVFVLLLVALGNYSYFSLRKQKGA
jgi:hypothetical protein